MPIPEISIAQFNEIAGGKYNAGFVDFATDEQGNVVNGLTKVNNHVTKRGENRVELSPERVLEVKEAFSPRWNGRRCRKRTSTSSAKSSASRRRWKRRANGPKSANSSRSASSR